MYNKYWGTEVQQLQNTSWGYKVTQRSNNNINSEHLPSFCTNKVKYAHPSMNRCNNQRQTPKTNKHSNTLPQHLLDTHNKKRQECSSPPGNLRLASPTITNLNTTFYSYPSKSQENHIASNGDTRTELSITETRASLGEPQTQHTWASQWGLTQQWQPVQNAICAHTLPELHNCKLTHIWWGRLTALWASVSPFLSWCRECFAACAVFFSDTHEDNQQQRTR